MSKATHTDGPWIHQPGDRYVREESTGATVCLVCEDDGHIDRDRSKQMPAAANANLIAASPDLLAACRKVIAGYGRWADDGNVEHIISAILTIRPVITKLDACE